MFAHFVSCVSYQKQARKKDSVDAKLSEWTVGTAQMMLKAILIRYTYFRNQVAEKPNPLRPTSCRRVVV